MVLTVLWGQLQKETHTSMSEQFNAPVEVEVMALEVQGELGLSIVDQATYEFWVAPRQDRPRLATDTPGLLRRAARTRAKQFIKDATDFWDSIIAPARAHYQNLLDKKKAAIGPVENGVAVINRAIIGWDNDQERLRREAQRKIEEEARRKAQEERIEEAVHAEQLGASPELIDTILDTPTVPVKLEKAAPTYQKSSQVVTRSNWKAEVTDFAELVKFVAANPTFIELLMPNQSAINALAKAQKGSMTIPGLHAYDDRVVATGRG